MEINNTNVTRVSGQAAENRPGDIM